MIERLVAVDCQVIPTILSTHLKDGGICDYKLLRKLEKAGLISYDPTVFVSAFVQTSGEHIIKNNEHLTRAYRNNRKNHNKNPQVYISKFANQYQYESKTTPEPKRVIQQEAIINEVNQNHNSSKDEQLLYQGKLVPFITLNLSAFDDDPTIKSREFRHIFEFETPITNSNWLYHGNDYYNADEFANPYYQWTAHFISTGELDRQWVLNRCLEIQTNLWADNNKSYFRKLFDYLAVTDDEKIALQDGLMALLTHENKPVVNFALGYLKTIYQDERFNSISYPQNLLSLRNST